MKTPGAKSYNVLVIEDEDIIRDLTRRSLEQRGFRCETAPDGIAAENMMRRRPFDAVVVDLRMPRKHGHQLIADILQERVHPVVVVLTGLCEPKLVQDLLVRGVADIMLKPCNYDLLAAKLQTYLEHRQTAGGGQTGANPLSFGAQLDNTTQSLKMQLEEVSNSFRDTIQQLTRQKESLEEDLVRSIGVFESLMSLGESKNESHACRVEHLACSIGEAAGLTRMELKHVRVAALLHEIGQFGMPDAIRRSSPGELAPAHYETFKRYPEIGAALISEIPGLEPVVALIESHAENWDGTGFPNRKRGRDVFLGARIVRIADGVDAWVQAFTGADARDAVREHLADQRGKAYDPDLVPLMLKHLSETRDDSADEACELIEVSSLTAGMTLAEGLYDERGQFLARNGATITPTMLDLLTRLVPGRSIRVRRPEPEPARS